MFAERFVPETLYVCSAEVVLVQMLPKSARFVTVMVGPAAQLNDTLSINALFAEVAIIKVEPLGTFVKSTDLVSKEPLMIDVYVTF